MRLRRLLSLLVLVSAIGCKPAPISDPDKPQLTAGVRVMDEQLHSDMLARDMQVRIIVPVSVPSGATLPVVYLLHGAGVSYHDWPNNSQIASFAERGVVLVLPNMPGSYYIDQDNGPNQRYQSYFVDELIPAIHRLVPFAAKDRQHTALVGISRGGYGAAVIGLKHIDQFGFVGLLSPAIDFAERGFRWRAPLESLNLRHIFGPPGSEIRLQNNPLLLLRDLDPHRAPYFFIAAGDREVLLGPTTLFAKRIAGHRIPNQFGVYPGGHNWGTWNQALPALESAMWQYFTAPMSMRNVTS